MGNAHRTIAIPVEGSGIARTMYGTAEPAAYFSSYVSLGPFGLFASPGWDSTLQITTLQNILHFLTRPVVRGFAWTVRYDHVDLAKGLESLGLSSRSATTHVIPLLDGYSAAAAQFSATIRNQIRKAFRRGVSIRSADGESDVSVYYELHQRLVEERQWRGYRYPYALLLELSQLRDHVRLLLAECEGRVIAGGLFILDGTSVLYWHGVSDREHSDRFASRAVVDGAIRWACDIGASSFNLGGSAGVESIERFKAMWGAQRQENWTFQWSSPLWRSLGSARSRMKSIFR
jgi:hypothetical protein